MNTSDLSPLSLSGKTAVITGGSRGIGRAIALKFASLGANIALIYAGNTSAAEDTASAVREYAVTATLHQCDVSDFAACSAVVKDILSAHSRIDILVNNAGITRDALVPTMSEADYDAVLDINLKGSFNMIRHTYRNFMRGGGRIINITSIAGITGNAGQSAYCASKAGIIGLTKSVARELASRNVTCNAIAPGFIASDMTDALSPEAKASMLARIPSGRAGASTDIANAAAFLASDLSSYITGEVLRVDGGLAM